MDLSEIKSRLAGQAESVAAHLLPNGRRNGSEWCCGSTEGEKGDSLRVHLSGGKAGIWADFATSDGGDLIDLWMAVRGSDLSTAIGEIKSWLGVSEPKFHPLPQKVYRKPERPANCHRPKESSPVFDYLVGRGISAETLRVYEVGEQEHNGRFYAVFPFKRAGQLVAIKYRNLEDKEDQRVEKGCEPCLFGWQSIPQDVRTVLLTEGEIDAMTWHEYGMPAMSVPFGAGGGGKLKWIDTEFPHLERFEIIYISMDMDAAGQAGIPEMIDRLGRHRCRVISLPMKDANECRMAGIPAEQMLEAVALAVSPDPVELRSAESYEAEVMEEFFPTALDPPGFKPPWGELARNFRFTPAEVTIWTGWSGHGKSLVLSQLMAAAMDQGERACIFSGEIRPAKQLKRMVRQLTGMKDPPRELVSLAMRWLSGRLWIFDLVGSAKADRLRVVFEYARRRYAVTQFVIDSLMKCGMAEDDYSAQKLFVEGWTDFANEHGAHVHIVAHSRKGKSDRDESGRMDVKGSGGITDLAHNVFVMWRNKEKERQVGDAMRQGTTLSYEKLSLSDAILTCDKTREQELEGDGRFFLFYERRSMQYTNTMEYETVRYVTSATQLQDEEEYA